MALATTSYPVSMRSTGVGWAYGVGGRVGAMVGPMLAAVLLQNGWSASDICYVMGLPMLLGASCCGCSNAKPSGAANSLPRRLLRVRCRRNRLERLRRRDLQIR
jgi:MFS family permease